MLRPRLARIRFRVAGAREVHDARAPDGRRRKQWRAAHRRDAHAKADLFTAALCQVPLLDMVRFHKFLIARYWIAEYGDPDKADDFAYILRYSPYQNIREGMNLPPTLVTAGEYDSRVDPLHAKKFVAAVQNHVGQIDPLLLYMDFDAGHGYGKPKEQIIRDREYELRFIFSRLGMR
jgi:prolyl oligopeptidase